MMGSPPRRVFLAGLACLAATLTGCGFRPLYGTTQVDGAVAAEMAAIRIGPIGEDQERRVGQILRNELIDRLTAGIGEQPQRYVLQIELDQRTSALQIQTNDTVTRYNLVLVAKVHLFTSDRQVRIYETTARATGSYDVVESEYGTLVAEQETARDAARDLSNTIANLLALYFKRQGA